MKSIYLDNNATTPVDQRVVEAMLPFLASGYGNASSVHQFGREAKVALENSREQIASVINAEPSEIYFTSGGTESDNLALIGAALQRKKTYQHIIVGAAEHHAILEPAEYLHEQHGFELDLLPVDAKGFSYPDDLASLIKEKSSIVSVMMANNETGAIADIKSLVATARQSEAYFHTDAVQAVGKIPVDVRELDVDLLSLTGHKIYGPKGCGALFIKQGIKIAPLFHGGSQEKKRRPGTDNVAGVVGLAKALEIAVAQMAEDHKKLSELSGYFHEKIISVIPNVTLNGSIENRIPQVLNMSFAGIEGESIVVSLDLEGVAVSSGSACTSGAIEASHVLVAMGVEPAVAQGAIRFSMGRSTTKDDLDYVIEKLPPIVKRLRDMSPVYNQSE